MSFTKAQLEDGRSAFTAGVKAALTDVAGRGPKASGIIFTIA